MSSPYEDWRRFSYEETVVLRDLKRTANMTTAAGVLVALAGAVQRGKAKTRAGYYGSNAALLGGINMIKAVSICASSPNSMPPRWRNWGTRFRPK